MTQLKEQFSDHDWSFLVHLPTTVGVWMANQEQGGGPRAAIRARAALETALLKVREKYATIPLLAELTAPLPDAVSDAPQWANILQDCQTAQSLLQSRTDATTLNCFRLMLIDIAEAVARAAPNGDLQVRNLYNGPKRGWLGLYPLMANAVRFGRGPNVTRTEKMAINALIKALGAGALVQDWELDPFRSLSQA